MPLAITSLYAGLAGLIILALALNVVRNRRRARVGLGSGSDPELERAIRMHGNAIEYAPLIIILMGVAEMHGVAAWRVHVLGVALVLGRLLHAWGLSQSRGPSFGRATGMALTWLAVLAGSVNALLIGLGVF